MCANTKLMLMKIHTHIVLFVRLLMSVEKYILLVAYLWMRHLRRQVINFALPCMMIYGDSADVGSREIRTIWHRGINQHMDFYDVSSWTFSKPEQ